MQPVAPLPDCFISCPLWRRLLAILYDTVLLCCLVFIAWQPVPLIPESLHPVSGRAIRLGYLLAICFLFFGWFWRHGGQTPGMRAWRIKLMPMRPDRAPDRSRPVTWRTAWLRFIAALFSWITFGAGFACSIFHPEKLAWHDLFSRSRLIVLPDSGLRLAGRHGNRPLR